jgi:cell shape-determining protein MreC
MDMAEQILVIFLSTALAIFLVLGIVLLVFCIKIARHVRTIMEKAEAITDKAESVAEFVERAATPVAIGRIVAKVTEAVFHHKKSAK